MNEHDLASDSFGEDQGKDKQNIPAKINLEPHFDALSRPETFTNHIEQLKGTGEQVPHNTILKQLLSQFEPIDFEGLAFPEIINLRQQLEEETLKGQDENHTNINGSDREKGKIQGIKQQLNKFKLKMKHLLVISIDNVIKVAMDNSWGLCKSEAYIYIYNGAYWSELDKEVFQKFLGEAAEKMGVEKYSAKFYQFKEHLLKQFLSSAYLPIPEDNKDLVLINLMNGTFEIGPHVTELRQFAQKDFITYQLPFSYDSDAKAPKFETYLNRVLPDIQSQKVLAEYLGYLFIKNGSNTLKEEKALILYGTGANGKSVFFEIVNALLGCQNVSNYSLQDLTDKEGYHRAKIANVIVNYASEINGKLETSIFKQMVSGEPIQARLPYHQPMMLKQYAKLIFNCNELPKDTEHTNAYFRRFLILVFGVTIPPEEQDKSLHSKIIEAELSGVFNWMLAGLHRLLEQKGFSPCDAAHNALEQYKTESNSVKLFLEETGYQKHATNSIFIKELYLEYRSFCTDEGITPFKKMNFTKQLKALGINVEKNMHGNAAYIFKEIVSF